MGELLRASGLAVGYPERRLRSDIALRVSPGEVLAVLGANGSGKSTLLRTLLGLQRPLAGEIWLGGRALASLARAQVARVAAYLPQAPAPVGLTAGEMVLLGRAPHVGPFARPRPADLLLAQQALQVIGMAPQRDTPLARLSGGERQLVAIARALVQAAPLVVFDEPTTGLDFGNQAVVLEQIARLKSRGLGVVFTTHDPRQASACADRVLLLYRDECCETGSPREMLEAGRLERVYGVKVAL